MNKFQDASLELGFVGNSQIQVKKSRLKKNGVIRRLRRRQRRAEEASGGGKEEKSQCWWKWMGFLDCSRHVSEAVVGGERGAAAPSLKSARPERREVDGPPVNPSSEECGEEKNEVELMQVSPERGDKRWPWGSKMSDSERKMERSAETLLMTALFFRQNMDRSKVGSAGRMPVEKSRKPGDPNENSVKAKARTEAKNRILRGIQAMSEPIWSERLILRQQQQIHENINQLLEQFMFLEAEDFSDFAVSSSKFAEFEGANEFEGNSDLNLKVALPKKVSSQILVNIKPFKEYLSKNYRKIMKASSIRMEDDFPCQKDLTESNSAANKEKNRKEMCSCGVFKSHVLFPERHVHRSVEGTSDESTQLLRSRHKSETLCYEDNQKEVSIQFNYGVLPKTSSCTVWGVYKTFPTCTRAEELKEAKKKKRKEKKEWERRKKTLPSVDEVLDDFSDTDHNLIFQKNLSQFRKKITALPPFDLQDSEVCEAMSFEIHEMKFERCDQWKLKQKSNKILEKMSLVLGEGQEVAVARSFGVRVETGAVERRQTAREVRVELESNLYVEVQRETPSKYEDSSSVLRSLQKMETFDEKALQSSAAILAVDSQEVGGRICMRAHMFRMPKRTVSETLSYFFHRVRWFYLFPDQCFSGVVTQENVGATELMSEESEGAEEEGATQHKLEVHGPPYEFPCNLTEILRKPSWNHVVFTYDNEFVFWEAGNPCEFKRNWIKTSPVFWSSVVGREAAPEPLGRKISELGSLKFQRDFTLDGLEIIYENSKQSLEDEEDPSKAVLSGSVAGRNHSLIYIVEESESQAGEHEEGWVQEAVEKAKASENLCHKSNSSPKENVAEAEFVAKDHQRTRRSLVFSDMERDFQSPRKRRLLITKGTEVKKTGSATTESRGPKSPVDKTFGIEETFRSPVFSDELSTSLDPKMIKQEGRKKVIVLENGSQASVKAEIAAFNSVKNLNAGNGETRKGSGRKSLVIVFFKK